MAEVSGDFMKRRVIKDALPPLCTFLSQQSPVSLKAGPVYTHSQAYKLQLIIIEGLGQLSVQLGFAAADLSQITETCLPYLSVRQPSQLQQVSIMKLILTMVFWCAHLCNKLCTICQSSQNK